LKERTAKLVNWRSCCVKKSFLTSQSHQTGRSENPTSKIKDLAQAAETTTHWLIVMGTEVTEPLGIATAQLATVGSPSTFFNRTRWIVR
jgi:hypothetical protein